MGKIADWFQQDDFGEQLSESMRGMRHRAYIRYLLTICATGVSAVWVGIPFALGVLIWRFFFERVIYRHIMIRHVLPLLKAGRPSRASMYFSVITLISSATSAALWLPLLVYGDKMGAFLAAGIMMSVLIYALIHYSQIRIALAASVAPQVIAVGAAALFIPISAAGPLVATACMTVCIPSLLPLLRDRRALSVDVARARQERAEAENANVAKSQFLATMSHELRTPLNAIIGYAEILEEDLDASGVEHSADDARRIRRAARNLLGLINEVLDLAKIESGKLTISPGPTDIAQLLQEVQETVAPIATHNNTTVRLEIACELGLREADGQRLRQCVLNLASNACKFTENGSVVIRADLAADEGRHVLRIAIEDNGRGISEADQRLLFQPFVQIDDSDARRHNGTGLGLVITRKLAQAMGGDVSMKSAVGVGSTFTLTIVAPPVRVSDSAVEDSGPLILVVEDDPSTAELIARALKRLELPVAIASSGAEALALLARKPALVVLDIFLPDMSGWDVLKALKGNPDTAQLPVVIVTVDDDRARAIEAGATEHMVKPIDRDRLTALVARLALSGQPQASPTPQIMRSERAASR